MPPSRARPMASSCPFLLCAACRVVVDDAWIRCSQPGSQAGAPGTGTNTSGGSQTAVARGGVRAGGGGGRGELRGVPGAQRPTCGLRRLCTHLVAQQLAIAHQAGLNKVGQRAAARLCHRGGSMLRRSSAARRCRPRAGRLRPARDRRLSVDWHARLNAAGCRSNAPAIGPTPAAMPGSPAFERRRRRGGRRADTCRGVPHGLGTAHRPIWLHI